MRVLAFISTLIGLCGCGKQAVRAGAVAPLSNGGPGQMAAADADYFRGLNQNRADLDAAVHLALPSTVNLTAPPVNAKAVALAKLITDGGCAATPWETPSFNFSADWHARQKVDGPATCPVQNVRAWDFVATNKTLTWDFGLVTRTEDFGKLTAATQLVAHGELHAGPDPKNKSMFVVKGTYNFTTFHVEGSPDLSVKMNILHVFSGTGGQGVINATLTLPGHWQHLVRIHWSADKTEHDFFVDGVRTSAKDFKTLFSFLEMDEILAKSKDMR